MRLDLTPDRLRAVYRYDALDGTFRYRVRPWNGRVEAGDVAGCIVGGYRHILIDGTRHKAHRLAWLYMYGMWPFGEIDHINGDRDDNRIANLRDVTRSENQQNVWAARKDNRTGHRGVCKLGGRSKRYTARIWRDGERVTLGHFLTAEEAGECYRREKAKAHIGSGRTPDAV